MRKSMSKEAAETWVTKFADKGYDVWAVPYIPSQRSPDDMPFNITYGVEFERDDITRNIHWYQEQLQEIYNSL